MENMHDLKELVEEHKASVSVELSEIAKNFQELDKYCEADFGVSSSRELYEKKKEIAIAMIRRYLQTEIGKRFTPLDGNLFRLNRFLKVKFFSNSCQIEKECSTLPQRPKKSEDGYQVRWLKTELLCGVGVYGDRSWGESRQTARLGQLDFPGKKYTTTSFHAKIPISPPKNAILYANESLSLLHSALSDLYKHPAIAPWLNETELRPRIRAYWIPDLKDIYYEETIKPPASDPILVLHLNQCHFLIDKWDEPENSRLNTLIAEFT